MHPTNLALRFFLEIAALGGFGVLAWQSAEKWWRYLAVIATLTFLMTLWATFAVPDDPSRSGKAPIPISGLARLVLELVVLMGGAYAFYKVGFILTGIGLAALIVVHYALSGERIAWLFQH